MSISRKTKDGEIFTVRHFVHRPVWSLNKKKKKERKKKMEIEVEKRKTEGWLVRLVLN